MPPSPNGLPTATTQSPTFDFSLSPQVTKGSFLPPASIFRSARSVFSSRPTTVPGCRLLSCRITVILSALPTTWLLVTIRPLASMMKPEPSATASRPACGTPRFSKNFFRKSSKGDAGPSPRSADWSEPLEVSALICAEMLTTAGWTRCTKGLRLGRLTEISFCTSAVTFLSGPLPCPARSCAPASAGVSSSASAADPPMRAVRGGVRENRGWRDGMGASEMTQACGGDCAAGPKTWRCNAPTAPSGESSRAPSL